MHPWEIDPGQPRVKEAAWKYKFRHYINLDSTFGKLKKLLVSFSQCNFITCSRYLEIIFE